MSDPLIRPSRQSSSRTDPCCRSSASAMAVSRSSKPVVSRMSGPGTRHSRPIAQLSPVIGVADERQRRVQRFEFPGPEPDALRAVAGPREQARCTLKVVVRRGSFHSCVRFAGPGWHPILELPPTTRSW